MRTDKLQEGMVTATDVVSIVGATIVPKGTVLDFYNIGKISRAGVTAVIVEVDNDGVVNKQQFSSVEEVKNSDEFKKFKENFEVSKGEVKRSLDRVVRTDKEIDFDKMISDVDVVMSNACTGMEVFEMLNCMKDEMNDVYKHSLSVSMMSAVLAKWARLPKEEIDEIVVAALLHDVGKLKVPYEVLSSKKLTSEEKRFLRKHAIYGYNILKDKVDDTIAQVALSHHERYDGSGYPMAQKGLEIPKYARLVAIADIFDEFTGNRGESGGNLCPFDVIRIFERDGFQKFDTEYLLAFLSGIADTYVGYNVRLSNGKEGSIIFANKSRPSRPMVKVDNMYVDLAKEKEIQIVQVL